jgi:hypothetical protein
MPSPFPGMNPYIEQPAAWKDFHSRFIPIAAELLGAQVLPRYYVKIEEHVFIHEPPAGERFPLGRPDLSLHPGVESPATPTPGPATAMAPAFVGLPAVVEEERLPYLEITDRANRNVVTVLELLSPTNKQTKAERDQYLAKVNRVLASGMNLVEIDLLRGGPRMPWRGMPACDYCVIVSRVPDRKLDPPRAVVLPIRLRDPLPTIPVPLRPGEPEPTLDLQAILHRIYDSAGYRLFIYDTPPEPPLEPADAIWATQLLQPQA